jgi:hypothetical protein
MKTQAKLESEPRQSNQNHHLPFYHSAELVAAVHRAEGGIFETFRAAHALGASMSDQRRQFHRRR